MINVNLKKYEMFVTKLKKENVSDKMVDKCTSLLIGINLRKNNISTRSLIKKIKKFRTELIENNVPFSLTYEFCSLFG